MWLLPTCFVLLLGGVQLSLALPSGEPVTESMYGYVKPVGAFSPNDIRGPKGGQVSGHYTLVSPKTRWPKGLVPWEWATGNTFTDDEKALIKKAMQQIQNETCLVFKEKTDQTAFMSYKNDESGCWATLGYQGKKQDVNMAKDCFGDTTTAIHEVMHALGFEHEQSRYDRDMVLEVLWDNIEKGNEAQFDKLPRTYAFPSYQYDLDSLMQYVLDGFGINGRPTMLVTAQNSSINVNTIGKAPKMSKTDINRMRSAYKCDYQGEGAAKPDGTKVTVQVNVPKKPFKGGKKPTKNNKKPSKKPNKKGGKKPKMYEDEEEIKQRERRSAQERVANINFF